jgi:two-component sensor histidine kinase
MAHSTSTDKEDAALSLTVAVVASSNGPLLLLNEGLDVVVASRSFSEAFAIDPQTVVGKSVFELGGGEWDVPQLRSLLSATAAGDPPIEAYEFDLGRAGAEVRTLSVHAQRLAYLDLEQVRLLVAVTDITEARANANVREQLGRENLVLLREVRHRVANSLQIVASVLLQGARRSQSEETRSHLRDAHNRVMSVAALERQLSGSTGEDVQLRTYLTKLCKSIGDSMIHEADKITIEVVCDDGTVPANTSVCLGLMTTELVINALKHAFPEGRAGKVTVTYAARGASWTLGVSDNGAGMRRNPDGAVAGLGTSIVQALARQLAANVEVTDRRPGVAVSVVHAAADRPPHEAAQAAL